jgi:4'-phosphopantetheinyl transferase
MVNPLPESPQISPGASWYPPPQPLTLKEDEVHVWRAALDLEPSQVQNLQQILSPDEKARAERFYFPKDRKHFRVARGLLRTILGRYLDMGPGRLRFSYSTYGKPALIPLPGQKYTLSFNMSHSHGLALYGFTRHRRIGIDLEYIRTNFACEEIAERFFSPHEQAVLRTLPAEMKYEAFFTCWTRKEAYIKARGEGLSFPLDQFDVSLTPGKPAKLLNVVEDPLEAARWSLQALTPGPGYVAALAVEGQYDWQYKCWQWLT